MRNTKWIVILLALSLLILPGCAAEEPEVIDTWPGRFETTATAEPAGTESPWEEILTYAEYLEMSKEEQDAFYASFEDPKEFFQWFDAVKAIYDEERKENNFNGDDVLDLGGAS